MSPLRKLVREVNRIGTGLRKQLWLLRKKKRLQSSTRD
ncbi:hypothetical protein IMCC9480_2284 [Oxalobacteraceae bacterium IMCC9480]|nr:hypothetical protein IMCC9480_2284 [Oxalobacteraceae bacterium IMCC9480]